ncbi:hypothetical protein QQ045_031950 [Rhodiola kirilowii]
MLGEEVLLLLTSVYALMVWFGHILPSVVRCNNGSTLTRVLSSSLAPSLEEIIRLTGFREGSLPVTYLGAPLFRGWVRIDMFSMLVEKVNARICGWMKRFFSMGGRVTLVNSVLNAIGVHCMIVLPVPLTTLNRITSLMANFVLDSGGAKRRHWKCWEVLCRPKQSGDLGIRDPKSITLALHAKLAWSFLEQNTLWV